MSAPYLKAGRFVVVVVSASMAACSSKSTPNEDNFAAAIEAKLAATPQKCLPPISWPVSEEPGNAGNPYAMYDAGRGFVAAGLATERQDGPNPSTNFRKKALFSLTAEGRKLLVRDESQPLAEHETGGFCYGRLKVGKVLKWDEPTNIGGRSDTTVLYSYSLADVPKWAENPILKQAYPALATDIEGKGHATLPVTLLNGEWRAQ
jgi:hypothetical protein